MAETDSSDTENSPAASPEDWVAKSPVEAAAELAAPDTLETPAVIQAPATPPEATTPAETEIPPMPAESLAERATLELEANDINSLERERLARELVELRVEAARMLDEAMRESPAATSFDQEATNRMDEITRSVDRLPASHREQIKTLLTPVAEAVRTYVKRGRDFQQAASDDLEKRQTQLGQPEAAVSPEDLQDKAITREKVVTFIRQMQEGLSVVEQVYTNGQDLRRNVGKLMAELHESLRAKSSSLEGQGESNVVDLRATVNEIRVTASSLTAQLMPLGELFGVRANLAASKAEAIKQKLVAAFESAGLTPPS